jgi:hypothetical protein
MPLSPVSMRQPTHSRENGGGSIISAKSPQTVHHKGNMLHTTKHNKYLTYAGSYAYYRVGNDVGSLRLPLKRKEASVHRQMIVPLQSKTCLSH